MINTKKADFTASNYLVFMFLVVSLVGVIAGLAGTMMNPYEVETTSEFDNYVDQFNPDDYQNEELLELDSSNSQNGEFSEYESSFKFGEQVKTTKNQTSAFVSATTAVLGIPAIVWYIVAGVVIILIGVLFAYYLRGINEK